MNLEISNRLLIKLGAYADKHGMATFEEAIQHLLSNAQDGETRDDILRRVRNAYAHQRANWENDHRDDFSSGGVASDYASPEVSYFASDSTKISEEEFREELLKTKRAKVVLLYHGNKPKRERLWRAERLKEDSNVKMNLNTGYLRRWREKGIKELRAYILPPLSF